MQAYGLTQKQPLSMNVTKGFLVSKWTATQEIRTKVTEQSENFLRVSLSSNLDFRIQKIALYHECIHSNLFFYLLDRRPEVFLARMYSIIYRSENEPNLAGHGMGSPLIFA